MFLYVPICSYMFLYVLTSSSPLSDTITTITIRCPGGGVSNVLICSYMFLHVLICSYIFFSPFRHNNDHHHQVSRRWSFKCSYMFLYVLTCSYMFLHLLFPFQT